MNAAKQYYNQNNPTQSISIVTLVKDILKDSDLSKNASNILAQLALASGYEGYCWMLIETISKNSRLGRSQTKLYLKELVTKKRIKIHHRPGRSSKFEVLDITNQFNEVSRSTGHIKEYSRKENVKERPNVILNFPDKESAQPDNSQCEITKQVVEKKTPPTLAEDNKIIIPSPNTGPKVQEPVHQPTRPIKTSSNLIDMTLVQEIIQITNDRKSTACFIKIVKNVPKNIIYAALSSLKIAMDENYILRPGAYFVSTIKNYYPDVFTGQRTCHDSPVTKNNSIVVPPKTSKKQCFEQDNIIPASPEVALEAINKIKLILNKPRSSMLYQEVKVGKHEQHRQKLARRNKESVGGIGNTDALHRYL
jgi:hypothetical protein